MTEDDLQSRLNFTTGEVVWLTSLCACGEEMRPILEHYASIGIFSLTRADTDYPERYRTRLKDSVPAFKEPPIHLPDWLKERALSLPSRPGQLNLF